MVVLIGIALIFSSNRKAIKLRTVGVAFGLQFCIGGIVLFWDTGKRGLEAVAFGVQRVINYSQDGLDFLFGGLVTDTMYELFGDARQAVKSTKRAIKAGYFREHY